jgi:hypothetical protein
METRVYQCDSKNLKELEKVLAAEPYAERSFSKQGYVLKEGRAVAAEQGKHYLYVKAAEDFFKFAENALKAVPSVTRCKKDEEQRVAAKIEEEQAAAEQGFGAIFG